MQNMITDSGTVVYYVIRANGMIISEKFENSMMAEMEKQKLPSETKQIAEIVPVTADNKQLLFE